VNKPKIKTRYTSVPDSVSGYVANVLKNRELIWVFAVRDLKVKYSQTLLGIAWSLVQPLGSLLVYVFFLGSIFGSEVDGIPYFLYVLAGLICWNLFSYIVYQGSGSVQNVSEQIRKVYFPKLLLPLSKATVAMVEFGIGFILLMLALMVKRTEVSSSIWLLPIPVLLTVLVGLTIAIGVAAISIKYRDFAHLVPFAMGIGMWCTPVFFAKDLLPNEYQFMWYLNPMAGVMELWRFVLFARADFDQNFLYGLLSIPLLCSMAVWVFAKNESEFAEFI
jgi:lipopolysaccharide transport system permease protein